MARAALSVGVAAIAAIGAYLFIAAPPACDSTRTLETVADELRDQFQLRGIFVNNARMVSGRWFGDSRDCVAEIARIRGNEDASSLPWREIRYRIVSEKLLQSPAITVELGGTVPLAPVPPSLWARLLAYL